MATQRKRPRAYSSPACYLHELSPAHKAAHRGDIQIKRIYDDPDAADGFRALVDRLWPRGISKRHAALDEWLVELAPSTTLRQWFHPVIHCAITHSCCGMCCASLNAG